MNAIGMSESGQECRELIRGSRPLSWRARAPSAGSPSHFLRNGADDTELQNLRRSVLEKKIKLLIRQNNCEPQLTQPQEEQHTTAVQAFVQLKGRCTLISLPTGALPQRTTTCAWGAQPCASRGLSRTPPGPRRAALLQSGAAQHAIQAARLQAGRRWSRHGLV